MWTRRQRQMCIRDSLNIDYSYKSKFRTRPGLDMNDAKDIIKDFGIINMALNYNLTKNIKLNFSINNLFNKVYAVASRPAGLRPGQPRVIKFGVRLDL